MDYDLNVFRKEYVRQKKLESIVNARSLVRPNVKKWQVATLLVVLPFLILLGVLFLSLLNLNSHLKAIFICIFIVLFIETYLRFCLIILIKRYQAVAKKETRKRCKCIPSCSEYAILCLKMIFPLLLALLKIRKRLFKTCNGEEYKIDFPTKKMSEKYENKL